MSGQTDMFLNAEDCLLPTRSIPEIEPELLKKIFRIVFKF